MPGQGKLAGTSNVRSRPRLLSLSPDIPLLLRFILRRSMVWRLWERSHSSFLSFNLLSRFDPHGSPNSEWFMGVRSHLLNRSGSKVSLIRLHLTGRRNQRLRACKQHSDGTMGSSISKRPAYRSHGHVLDRGILQGLFILVFIYHVPT
jgi:hypothetical protein